MDPILAAKLASAGLKVVGFLKANWRYVAIGVLALALVVQHGCLKRARADLKVERVAHAQDVRTAKDNDRKAKEAVAKANASVEAVRAQGLRDTAAAEKAASDARRAAQVASRTAAQVMARKAGPGGYCPAIHQLRLDTTR